MSRGSSPRPHDPAKFREGYERIFKTQMAQRVRQLQADRDAAMYGTYPARERRLVRNAARCRDCGEVLESKHRHDYRSCACGNFVDGGLEYVRRGFMREDALEDLCEYEEDMTREEG